HIEAPAAKAEGACVEIRQHELMFLPQHDLAARAAAGDDFAVAAGAESSGFFVDAVVHVADAYAHRWRTLARPAETILAVPDERVGLVGLGFQHDVELAARDVDFDDDLLHALRQRLARDRD